MNSPESHMAGFLRRVAKRIENGEYVDVVMEHELAYREAITVRFVDNRKQLRAERNRINDAATARGS